MLAKAIRQCFAPHMSGLSGGGAKRLSEMQHGSGQPLVFLRNLDLRGGQGQYDYRREVGAGTDASVVMAPIQWVQRSLPEAPLVVERTQGAAWEPVPSHPLAALVARPNPHYGGNHLWQATVFSFLTDGNAYWIVIRNGAGRPIQLWYTPHWLIHPRADGKGDFIAGYTYRPAGKEIPLEREDVVHFRHGIDPQHPRQGVSPIASALREIWSDGEAAEFTATLLRNAGIPGLIVSPDGDVSLTGPEQEEMKRYLIERTTGPHRGEPVIASGKTKLERLAWSPREMDLSPATDRAEERVCALLGIPAAVVGFGSGLETTKVGATMAEMRRLAWENGIIPLHRNFAAEVTHSLLPAFPAEGRVRVRFDTSGVAALQEDRNRLSRRVDTRVRGGWMSVAAAKRAMGLRPQPGDDVYLRRSNTVEVPARRQAGAR